MKLLTEQKIYFTLRIASAMCFIGHGAFGIITKPVWANYFGVFGIGHDLSWQLMPVVGTIDILLGLALLFYPLRGVFAWLVVWGLFTALLRPLSGEPFAEFIERAGNFGAPLALLLFSARSNSLGELLVPISKTSQPATRNLQRLIGCLRIVVFLLILGHGWLNLIEKKAFLDIYRSVGFANPGSVAQALGLFEIIIAFAILIRPFRSLVLIVFFWKVGTELFYPHYGFFEWVERGGSYGSILALWLALDLIPEAKLKAVDSFFRTLLHNVDRSAFQQSLSNEK